jgi:hypothetical protein
MSQDRLQLELPAAVPSAYRQVSADSPRGVDQRLAGAERELRVQFTRIAQIQVQLDLLLSALRRSSDGTRVCDS